MTQFRRFFDRELVFLDRLRGQLQRRLPGRSRRAPARKPRGPRAGHHRLLGIGLSVLVHAALLVLLARLLAPVKPARPGNSPERWFTVQLLIPPPQVATPAPPPPQRSTPPPRPQDKAKTLERSSVAVEESNVVADSSKLARLAELQAPAITSRAMLTRAVVGSGPASAPTDAVAETATASDTVHRGDEGEFASRGSGRAEALARHGGSAGTEDAVFRGLTWLAAHQDRDGGWDADGFNRHCVNFSACFGEGQSEFDVGVTGLAVLAFLGAGHRPTDGTRFATAVDLGLAFLLRSQSAAGGFGRRSEKHFYNHAIASFAVAEAFGMTRDSKYLDAATRALRFSAHGQQVRGGWDYRITDSGRNDLSVTGWHVMAIRSCRTIGIPVPPEMVQGVRRYLEDCVGPTGRARYADRGVGKGRGGVGMKAVGLLARLYMGASPSGAGIRGALAALLRNPPEVEKTYEWDRTYQSFYYWYHGTLAVFHLGGKAWEFWNHVLREAVLPLQSRDSHEDGSWSPDGNWIGASGGRIAATALMVLTLEVYYRYPPLHAYRQNVSRQDVSRKQRPVNSGTRARND